MRKECFSVQCPKRVQFGDPMYFETFEKERLSKLVADCSPPKHFCAQVVLQEDLFEEFPEMMNRVMTLFMAPEKYLSTYAEGYMYQGQQTFENEIGVDTARYLLDVDGRYDEILTGGDGYWGQYTEIFRTGTQGKILDAMIISICMPDSEDFESMKRLMNYFFQDVHCLENKKETQEERSGSI